MTTEQTAAERLPEPEVVMEEPLPATWKGQPVTVKKEPLGDLAQWMPTFRRQEIPGNELQDTIHREPMHRDEPEILITTVSRNYDLVQHDEVLEVLIRALKASGIDTAQKLEARMMLANYGARMRLALRLPGFDFDPGDRHPIVLDVDCLNSVEKSSSLVVRLLWRRLVCSNGLMVDHREETMRRIHSDGRADPEQIAHFLNASFERAKQEQGIYKKWMGHPIDEDRIREWVDGPVNGKWKSHLAARAYSIATHGYDGEIEKPFEKCLPHQRSVKRQAKVPGAHAPVRNVFHASQVLSWLASQQATLEGRYTKFMDIPELMEPLLPRQS